MHPLFSLCLLPHTTLFRLRLFQPTLIKIFGRVPFDPTEAVIVVIFAEGGLIFSLTSSFVPLRSSMRAVCSSTGLSGQQPAHRPLLWVQYHDPLPSYWTYGRFLRQLDNARLKSVRIFIFPITKVHFNRPQTLFPPLLLCLLLLSHKVFHCPEKFLL